MSNVSIYEKNWIDLVFEGKNKAYGAYQLRQENSRTTLLAFIAGVVFLISVSGLGLLLSSFSNETINCPIIPIGPTITPVELTVIPITKPAQKEPQRQNPNPVEPTNLSNMVVAPTPQVIVNVPTNTQITNEPTATSGTTGGTGTEVSTPGNSVAASPVDTSPTPAVLLDKLPAFPGGINKFYQYVGANFERPTIEDAAVVTVLVSFVIEIDGSITDIKILRNPGYGMGNEAIRVLKSLKTKWSPGILNGEKVRTLYTLPIKVKSE
ncbi:energy transducer TonB [Flavobacterium sp. RSB2_4_14]|uniref:energy transducer TonB n=1 Tax=Flavobacterium sp. RSB2_4_14 TaxID=3447665 RepID=UPI003F359C92